MENYPTNIPADLYDKVMKRISMERSRRAAIRRFTISALVCVLAATSSVFVWNAFTRELVASGFGQYLSLAFIDLRAVLANWQDFCMSLLESFPIVNAVGLLGEIIILMLSTKFIVIYWKQYLAYGKYAAR